MSGAADGHKTATEKKNRRRAPAEGWRGCARSREKISPPSGCEAGVLGPSGNKRVNQLLTARLGFRPLRGKPVQTPTPPIENDTRRDESHTDGIDGLPSRAYSSTEPCNNKHPRRRRKRDPHENNYRMFTSRFRPRIRREVDYIVAQPPGSRNRYG